MNDEQTGVRELEGALDQATTMANDLGAELASSEAKLDIVVSALRGFATRWHYAGQPIGEVERIRDEAQRALVEIGESA
jgi:hypothetical protein